MQALIEELAALVQKIKTGQATLGELEAFAAGTAQLNERAIILRYKAYEAQVYGTMEELPVEAAAEQVVAVEEAISEPVIEAPSMEDAVNEEPAFDLFSLDEEAEEPTFELSMEEQPVFEAEDHVPHDLDPAPEMHLDELEISHEEEPVAEAETPVKPVVEEPVMSGNLHGIYTKLSSNDGSLAARLMTVRLETLKGAFGFNERLQIIQELFNGSNDEFSSLIDRIETTPSKDQARQVVSAYASKFNWDEESPLALELIQKVERKYA